MSRFESISTKIMVKVIGLHKILSFQNGMFTITEIVHHMGKVGVCENARKVLFLLRFRRDLKAKARSKSKDVS